MLDLEAGDDVDTETTGGRPGDPPGAKGGSSEVTADDDYPTWWERILGRIEGEGGASPAAASAEVDHPPIRLVKGNQSKLPEELVGQRIFVDSGRGLIEHDSWVPGMSLSWSTSNHYHAPGVPRFHRGDAHLGAVEL